MIDEHAQNFHFFYTYFNQVFTLISPYCVWVVLEQPIFFLLSHLTTFEFSSSPLRSRFDIARKRIRPLSRLAMVH